MSPFELVEATLEDLLRKQRDNYTDIDSLEDRLDELIEKRNALKALIDEYEDFIRQSKEVDANSGNHSGVLVESSPEDVRQPGAESGVPL